MLSVEPLLLEIFPLCSLSNRLSAASWLYWHACVAAPQRSLRKRAGCSHVSLVLPLALYRGEWAGPDPRRLTGAVLIAQSGVQTAGAICHVFGFGKGFGAKCQAVLRKGSRILVILSEVQRSCPDAKNP
jgi:hypothetical protein